MNIAVQKLSAKAKLPQKMSDHASGYDLFACLDTDVKLAPGQRYAVSTGLAMEIPVGFEAQIRPRSGLALKLGLGVLNSPGTIDADYRGEIKVILINLSETEVIITPNMRIAQIIITPVLSPIFTEVESLSSSVRQDGGFGHTGSH
jgi:dUTP pyrophosphatase